MDATSSSLHHSHWRQFAVKNAKSMMNASASFEPILKNDIPGGIREF